MSPEPRISERRRALTGIVVLATLTACTPDTPLATRTDSIPAAITITVTNDRGGNIHERIAHHIAHSKAGTRIRIDGLCASACLIRLSDPRTCVTANSRFYMHRAVFGDTLKSIPRSDEQTFKIVNGLYKIYLPFYLMADFDALEPGPGRWYSGTQMIRKGALQCL